jgi:two-component system OmpR family sensor kinase
MSIRLRVTLATVVLAGLAVGAADVTTFMLLRDYFDKSAATSVRQVSNTAVAALTSGKTIALPTFSGTDRPVLVEVRDKKGKLVARTGTSEAAQVRLPADLLSHPGRPRQIDIPGQSGPPAFEVLAVRTPSGETVVSVVSLSTEATTLEHLFKLNLIVGVIVITLLAIVAAILLGQSLRPLRRIAATADQIAAGDLTARVPAAPKRSEIGRVATALNRMLAEIETAFGQRDATETRLRQFLADASHELRTPLTSIRGYAELFRRGADHRPEDLAKAMRAIEDEATRMTLLVEDLLLLARLDDVAPLERSRVAVDDVVESAIEAARVVEPDRLLQFEFADRPIVVMGDARRLRQVFDNLLANVREHTPPDAVAFVSVRTAGDEVIVSVEDTGPGIPVRDQELVFDRFFRPDAPRERRLGGAGLGLAIVRSIVTAHGGEIGVRPAVPHGSIFEIRLPATSAVKTPAPAVSSHAAS